MTRRGRRHGRPRDPVPEEACQMFPAGIVLALDALVRGQLGAQAAAVRPAESVKRIDLHSTRYSGGPAVQALKRRRRALDVDE